MARKKRRGGGRRICCPKGSKKMTIKGKIRCMRGGRKGHQVKRRKHCRR